MATPDDGDNQPAKQPGQSQGQGQVDFTELYARLERVERSLAGAESISPEERERILGERAKAIAAPLFRKSGQRKADAPQLRAGTILPRKLAETL